MAALGCLQPALGKGYLDASVAGSVVSDDDLKRIPAQSLNAEAVDEPAEAVIVVAHGHDHADDRIASAHREAASPP